MVSKELTREISKAAIAEVKQPRNLNLGTNFETISRQKPFTSNVKSPNVINVIGKDINSRIGFMVIFTRASTNAAMIAVIKSSIVKSLVRRPTA